GDGIGQVIEIDTAASAAAFLAALVTGPVDQESAHGLGGGGEEVAAAVPVPGPLHVYQARGGVGGQGGGVRRRARLFLGPAAGRPVGATRRRPAAAAAPRRTGRPARWRTGCR